MKTKSSIKSFGILFFIVFLAIGLWPIIDKGDLRLWSIFLSIIFLILGLIESRILAPLNKYWIKLGELLGKIIAPIVMLIIFLLVVTPISIFVKLANKDILNLKLKKKLNTYWIKRSKNLSSMKNQF
jgi:hypothetical protein